MNQVTENIKRIFEENGIEHRIFEHEPVYTCQQAADVRGVGVDTGVKALLVKTTEGKYIMILVTADQKVDLKKVAKLEGTKKLNLASPDEVYEVTGCKIGSVPPFGFKKNIKTYLDEEVLEKEDVNFNAGGHSISASMKGKDMPKVIDNPILFRNRVHL